VLLKPSAFFITTIFSLEVVSAELKNTFGSGIGVFSAFFITTIFSLEVFSA
jgi:hypothetical protein